MPTYRIDVSKLPDEQIPELKERLSAWAFSAFDGQDRTGKIAYIDIVWDRKENFLSVYDLPPNCTCTLVMP